MLPSALRWCHRNHWVWPESALAKRWKPTVSELEPSGCVAGAKARKLRPIRASRGTPYRATRPASLQSSITSPKTYTPSSGSPIMKR